MATYSKRALSGSTNGRQIKVVSTATAGTTIHTAVTGTSDLDEIWLYAVNMHTADVNLTIEFGGTTSPDDLIQQTIATKAGLALVIPGLVLQNECVVKAFASVANVVLISGFVNRVAA